MKRVMGRCSAHCWWGGWSWPSLNFPRIPLPPNSGTDYPRQSAAIALSARGALPSTIPRSSTCPPRPAVPSRRQGLNPGRQRAHWTAATTTPRSNIWSRACWPSPRWVGAALPRCSIGLKPSANRAIAIWAIYPGTPPRKAAPGKSCPVPARKGRWPSPVPCWQRRRGGSAWRWSIWARPWSLRTASTAWPGPRAPKPPPASPSSAPTCAPSGIVLDMIAQMSWWIGSRAECTIVSRWPRHFPRRILWCWKKRPCAALTA